MPNPNNELCALCYKEKPLVKSHLIPKFVFKKMISEGGLLRFAVKPNVRAQDGFKLYLLCEECEELFSKPEKLFSEIIFTKVLEQRVSSFNYGGFL